MTWFYIHMVGDTNGDLHTDVIASTSLSGSSGVRVLQYSIEVPHGTTSDFGPWELHGDEVAVQHEMHWSYAGLGSIHETFYKGPSNTGPWESFADFTLNAPAGTNWWPSTWWPISPVTSDLACAYGVERNPDSEPFAYITGALVDTVVALMGGGPLAIVAFDALIGAPFIGPTCEVNPTLPPPLTDADFINGTVIPQPGSLGKLKDNFLYSAWSFFCRCKAGPGGGSPPPAPPAPIVLPPVLQPQPHTVDPCSENDTCSSLTTITNILTQLNVGLNLNRYTTASTSYSLGTSHSGLSGNGVLAVSAIRGVLVSLTTVPARLGTALGAPDTIWDAGWINLGDAYGFSSRQFITTLQWLFLPAGGQPIDQVGYSIPNDVVVTITELLPTP